LKRSKAQVLLEDWRGDYNYERPTVHTTGLMSVCRERAGASASAAFIGEDGWVTSTGTLLGVPNFGTLTFTNCLIDGKTLASWHPHEYQRVNHVGIVQIAPGALSLAGTAFATYYNHS